MTRAALVLGLLLALPVMAEAGHWSRPDRVDCFIPGFDDHTGFAIFNPETAPGIPGPPIFESLRIRGEAYVLMKDGLGGYTTYFSFGEGYFKAVVFPEEEVSLPADAESMETVTCYLPGMDNLVVEGADGDIRVRARAYVYMRGVDGSDSRYFPFGQGYCRGVVLPVEEP